MALRVDLDAALQIIVEPGFYQPYSSKQIGKEMIPTNDVSNQAFWRDPAYRVIMKMPQQLQDNWLNTEKQVSSIIGLTDHGAGTFVPNATDITNKALHETNIMQNPNNPWIHHSPITPAVVVPQGVTGQGGQGSLITLLPKAEITIPLLETPPVPDTSDLKCLCYTEEDLRWNQPLFIRWHVPYSFIGHPTVYGFMIGQFALLCHGSQLEIFLDVSESGTRDSWQRIRTEALFSTAPADPVAAAGAIGTAALFNGSVVERTLFWLPYRRHHVFIQTDVGKWMAFTTRTYPTLNKETGNEQDWAIVEPRKLSVWGLTRGAGRFQVQKVKFIEGTHSFRINPFVIDYTPASPLTADNLLIKGDEFRGTDIDAAVPVTPPGYSVPTNELDTCPPLTTGDDDEARSYGFHFTMEASSDAEFTPFLYGFDVAIPAVGGTWAKTPLTVSDKIADGFARIQRAEFSHSLKRGENELTVEIMDFPTFPAATQYFRSSAPVRLYDTVGPVNLFVGITDPTEVNPLRLDLGILRRMTVHAHDLWKILEDTYLRDQRDWGPKFSYVSGSTQVLEPGKGHIFVVDFIARQAGIDTTGADYPGLGIGDPNWDWPLGGVDAPGDTQTGDTRPGWQPASRPPDTAASFIERIASLFSGWDVGFYPTGQFYYRPKDYYFASEVTFDANAGGAFPRYRPPVDFRHEEPELNVLQIEGQDAQTGNPLVSSRWVDFASIRNVSAPNFLGRWRAGYAKVDGAFTCPQLNWMAYILWNAARRRHLLVRFEAEYYQPLKVGHCFTLEGYPGRWRLQNYTVEKTRHGWSPASYEAELVERGFL